MTEYVSLHNYTYFSIMRSINKPSALMDAAAALGMKAIAVTDYGTLSGLWDSYKAAKKTKLICGCQINFTDTRDPVVRFLCNEDPKPQIQPRTMILIAKNAIGYKHLLEINFEAEKCKLEKNSKIDKVALIDWDVLQEKHEGLICLTSNAGGIVGRHLSDGEHEKAIKEAKRFKELFGDDFAFELQPNNMMMDGAEQFAVNQNLRRLGAELGIRCVAASNAYYVNKEEAECYDFLVAIKNHRSYNDRSRPKINRPNFYLHSAEDIVKFFSRNYGSKFAEELCDNTVYYADKCEKPEWIKPQHVTGDKALLPDFPVHDQPDLAEFGKWKEDNKEIVEQVKADDKLYMRYWCEANWNSHTPKEKNQVYWDRYQKEELPVYEQLGFSSYMLITADFLQWGRKQNIRIGPGRGSVGCSLVAYDLDIHRADPIKYGLPFARFLNLDKKDYPDIDNDIEPNGRERIINYVRRKYGNERVVHVSNFVTFTPKNAITDVITSLEIGGSRQSAFKIAKNLTETISNEAKSIASAEESSPFLKDFLEKYPQAKKFAEVLIGLPRSYSTHAAGVVVSKYNLLGLVPLRIDEHGTIALEYEKTRTEENGLVKIDFLGLETLDIINKVHEIIQTNGGEPPLDPPDFDKYDKKIFDMISEGDTFGVFQFGSSGGTIDICKKVQPMNLLDLAAINALTRPGVSHDVRKSYIARRFGEEPAEFPHPSFELALKETLGLPIFEECFLFLAHYFCGWDLGRSDKMRKISKLKAKGKHLLKEIREGFIQGAMEHSGVTEEFVTEIWDEWVVPLSGYAFNKSHAIEYSMVGFQTAYLKAYYPAEFMTANLISEIKSNAPQAKDNALRFRHMLRKHGVKILPPDVNLSGPTYKLASQSKLITGFSALHGVQQPAAEDIANKRPFSSFTDFITRVDSTLVRSPVVEAMAACGALDCFGLTRKSMFLYAADLKLKMKNWAKRKTTQGKPFEYTLPNEEWTKGQLRALETHYLGEALSGTKKDSYPVLFVDKGVSHIRDMKDMPDKYRVVVELEVKDLFVFRVKKKESKIFNEEVCKITGEDILEDQIGVVVFPEQFAVLQMKYAETFGENAKLDKNFGLRLSGTISRYNGELSLTVSEIYALMKPVAMPVDMKNLKKERKKIEIYSGMSKKKLAEKTSEDITEDLLDMIVMDKDYEF